MFVEWKRFCFVLFCCRFVSQQPMNILGKKLMCHFYTSKLELFRLLSSIDAIVMRQLKMAPKMIFFFFGIFGQKFRRWFNSIFYFLKSLENPNETWTNDYNINSFKRKSIFLKIKFHCWCIHQIDDKELQIYFYLLIFKCGSLPLITMKIAMKNIQIEAIVCLKRSINIFFSFLDLMSTWDQGRPRGRRFVVHIVYMCEFTMFSFVQGPTNLGTTRFYQSAARTMLNKKIK